MKKGGGFRLGRILPQSKRFLADMITEGDVVVDATMGNGNDTDFLARCVGTTGKVYAFDVQQEALDLTTVRLGERIHQTELILDSHANLAHYVPNNIAAAVFNLGFLPNQKESPVITQADSTITALDAALELLKPGGMATVAVYDGHPGGPEERDAVLAFIKALDAKLYQVVRYEIANNQNHPPFLLIIEKSSRISKQNQTSAL